MHECAKIEHTVITTAKIGYVGTKRSDIATNAVTKSFKTEPDNLPRRTEIEKVDTTGSAKIACAETTARQIDELVERITALYGDRRNE